ncbi:formate nitrite transporter family [Diaporthe amygdali]|uniref:formate nitrite transporter family n=1 Tax=Phomopsis amygdali TaxID=1214568 RepID=UPI0022FDE0EE|nr:formate nitrite transporter family [Diaporthe amygdali]KAJ0119976.1 formate nitrite transporter family [Diaporthe amygdali]
MNAVNTFPSQELARLVSQAGVAKSRLSYPKYAIKAFMGGVFISFGALTDLVIASGCPGLRESNPALATMIAGFTFPLGLVLIMLTNMELVTSNMFVMPFTLVQRKITLFDVMKNWVLGYIGNLAGALFVAGFLAWWTDTLGSATESSYTVIQAEGRVNVQWSVNFLRGIGCNWFVALALFLSLGSVEFVSKIYCIWIPIWAFVILGYQHSIANFFQVPIGMFYGTSFSVGKFIYQSTVPVTLGNIVGGMVFGAMVFWYLYGRHDDPHNANEDSLDSDREGHDGVKELEAGAAIRGAHPRNGSVYRGPYDRNNMAGAV